MRLNNWILSACVGLLLAWALLSYFGIGLQDIIGTISRIGFGVLILTLILFAVTNLVRAVRFKILLRDDISVKELFNIVSLYILSSNILPARTGELSYVYLIKKRTNVSGSSAMSTLVISRISDFIAISLLFLLSLLLIENPPKVISDVFSVVGLFLLSLIIVLAVLVACHKWFIRCLIPLQQDRRVSTVRLAVVFLEKLKDFLGHFRVLDVQTIILCALTSLILWVVSSLTIYELLSSMGVGLGFTEIVLVSSAVALASIVPIPTIAGVGAVEGAWSLALISFGVPDKLAVPASFSVHIMIILYMVLCSLPSVSYVKAAIPAKQKT